MRNFKCVNYEEKMLDYAVIRATSKGNVDPLVLSDVQAVP